MISKVQAITRGLGQSELRPKASDSQMIMSSIAMAMLIIGVQIRPASINSITTSISDPLRLVMLLVVAGCVIYVSAKSHVNKIINLAIAFFLFVFSYAHILGEKRLYIIPEITMVWVALCVILLSIIAFGISMRYYSQALIAKLIVYLSVLWAIIIYASGGIEFGILPKFNFDIYSIDGYVFDYTQGATSFFGVASICSIFLIKYKKNAYEAFINALISIFFLSLCLAGGSRGEIFFTVTIILLILKPSGKFFSLVFIISSIFFTLFMAQYLIRSDTDIVAINRAREVLTGSSFGLRDVLYGQAIDLLRDNPLCLAFGCGTLYFQEYYSYEYSLYPHNLLVEYIISSGLILIAPLLILFVNGIIKIKNKSIVYYIGLYFLFISMKSGDMYGSWITIAFFFWVSSYGFYSLAGKGIPYHRNL